MRPKTKDAQRLNLYLNRDILPDLKRIADEEGVSQSRIVERFVETGVKSNFGGIRTRTVSQLAEHADQLEEEYNKQCVLSDGGVDFPSHAYIPKSELDTPSKVLWWVRHLSTKNYMSPGLLRHFIDKVLNSNGYVGRNKDFVRASTSTALLKKAAKSVNSK
jgi:hypothetical protein